MAIALGLLAALLWGGADFMIRLIGRSLGLHRSMLYAQGLGSLTVGAWLASHWSANGWLREAPAAAWIAAVVSAAIGLVATLSLYRALQVGRIGVVSPLAGAYGAVAAVLSLLGGESLKLIVVAGIVIIVAGVVLVSAPGDRTGPVANTGPSGAGWATAACLGFGLSFWVQGRYAAPFLGGIVPVWIYYTFSTTNLVAAAAIRRPVLTLSPRDAGVVLGTGTLAVGGFVVVSLGLATGQVAVVTVLSSLQSAITVGLACVFLGERLAVHQWAGVAAVVCGLGLVRTGRSPHSSLSRRLRPRGRRTVARCGPGAPPRSAGA